MKSLMNRSHIHILPILIPLTFDFSPLTWMERLSWFSCILRETGSRSWVSLQALLWSASHMEAVHYFLEGLNNRCYKADEQTHTPWAQSMLSRDSHTRQYPYQESCQVMEGLCFEGQALLQSPANVSVWPCYIFSLSSWLGQCCLPTTSNALTLFRCISKDSSVRMET